MSNWRRTPLPAITGGITMFPHIEVRGEPRPEDLTPDQWSAKNYVRAVETVLRRIDKARVGRIILAHVPHRLVIQPYRSYRRRPGGTMRHGFDALHSTAADDSRFMGSGQGAHDLHVTFTPSHFLRPDGVNTVEGEQHPFHTDAVLLHEIFHAIEGMAGRSRGVRLYRSASDFEQVAEHRAVRITNMYRSENNRPLRGPYPSTGYVSSSGDRLQRYGLRGLTEGRGVYGYGGVRRVTRDPHSQPHSHAVVFEMKLIGGILRDHPGLSNRLLSIPESQCPYNPLRAFVEQRYDTLLVPAHWVPAVDDGERVVPFDEGGTWA